VYGTGGTTVVVNDLDLSRSEGQQWYFDANSEVHFPERFLSMPQGPAGQGNINTLINQRFSFDKNCQVFFDVQGTRSPEEARLPQEAHSHWVGSGVSRTHFDFLIPAGFAERGVEAYRAKTQYLAARKVQKQLEHYYFHT
jgi:hypothetical protein